MPGLRCTSRSSTGLHMPYRRSAFRVEFEARVNELLTQARKAQSLPRELGDQNLAGVRDMVFQCAIFQTSAALETYLKLIIESWTQALRRNAKGEHLPEAIKASFARRRLAPHFKRFAFSEEEGALHQSINAEADLWSFLSGTPHLPAFFDGRALHEACAYPSFKNLKKLFARLGVLDVDARLSRVLRRDVETLVAAFQDIRTALAHAAPPSITIKDVRDRLGDQLRLVAALDRVMFSHISVHGGPECWVAAA